MRVLHLIRDPGDSLAWEAVLAEPVGAEVRVVLVRGGADGEAGGARAAVAARGVAVEELGPGLDYDGVMALIEGSDRVVAW